MSYCAAVAFQFGLRCRQLASSLQGILVVGSVGPVNQSIGQSFPRQLTITTTFGNDSCLWCSQQFGAQAFVQQQEEACKQLQAAFFCSAAEGETMSGTERQKFFQSLSLTQSHD